MSDYISGKQRRIQDNKAIYVYFSSHRFNLDLNELNTIKEIRNTIKTIKNIINFLIHVFLEIQLPQVL